MSLTHFPPEFTLEVNASAKQIVDFATSSNTLENLAVADADVINVISGDPISVDQLSVLKGLDDVVLGSGTVDIADSDTKILAANDAVLGSAEVGIVTVNSGASTVTDGVSLNGMTKAVVFDVEGTAKDIYDNANSLGDGSTTFISRLQRGRYSLIDVSREAQFHSKLVRTYECCAFPTANVQVLTA